MVENVEKAITELKEALESADNATAVKEKMTQLQQASMKIGEQIYKSGESETQPNQTQDAEFEEKDKDKR